MNSEPGADAASLFVEIGSLGPGENLYTVIPSMVECDAIALRLDEPGLQRLQGDFTLAAIKGGVTLNLRISAVVDRLCVASLEPMTESIDETYTIQFERAASDLDDESTHEPLETDTLDLTEILIQHLSLSLDPHPRKPGATSLMETYRDAAILSPFVVLKGLVDDGA